MVRPEIALLKRLNVTGEVGLEFVNSHRLPGAVIAQVVETIDTVGLGDLVLGNAAIARLGRRLRTGAGRWRLGAETSQVPHWRESLVGATDARMHNVVSASDVVMSTHEVVETNHALHRARDVGGDSR